MRFFPGRPVGGGEVFLATHKIRVIQYGVGPIGAGIVRLMLQKPEIQIVGAIDSDPQKAGKDLGRIVGAERDLGVIIAGEARDVLRAGAHVVVHTTSSYLTQVTDQLLACLQAGSHVVSTCEELAYPFRKHYAAAVGNSDCDSNRSRATGQPR